MIKYEEKNDENKRAKQVLAMMKEIERKTEMKPCRDDPCRQTGKISPKLWEKISKKYINNIGRKKL